jgi:uncharacterized coiled-coil protein SlyX
MTLEERMTAMEKAYGTQSDLMRELRDAVTVTANLEARQGKVLKEHGEWLASHSEWLASHEAAMREHDAAMREHAERKREHDAAMKDLDVRITRLVSGFGAFMRGKEGA